MYRSTKLSMYRLSFHTSDRYVPFVGIMTMIGTEIQGADMEHIQRGPGGNLDLDHGPDPLLNLKGTWTSIFSLSIVRVGY
jgi:hypothetical protein